MQAISAQPGQQQECAKTVKTKAATRKVRYHGYRAFVYLPAVLTGLDASAASAVQCCFPNWLESTV